MTPDGSLAAPPQLVPVLVFLLVLASVVGMLYVLFHDRLSGRTALLRRLEFAGALEVKPTAGGLAMNEQRRRQSIEKALAEMTQRERAKQRARLTLQMRLSQAGLPWSVASVYLRVALTAAVFVAALRFGIGTRLVVAVPLGALAGAIAVHFYVKSKRSGRMRRFVDEFPNAIDIVTRGVKTGLPLNDCLKAIASEGQEPVRGEFRRIVDDLAVGLPLSQALARFAQRVPIMEANFFAVVVAMQGQLGGNLSEALGNLSHVLRDRKMMKQKIRAFSSEATSSGMIIASMPVVVGGILCVTSPDYIGLLFSDFTGNIVLAACGFWMAAGVLVMRNMIRFDF